MNSKKLLFDDVSIGDKIPSLVEKVTLLQLVMYSAASWNFYRLHWDREFARNKGFRDVNVHGPLLGAFLSQMLVNWIGESGTLKKLKYRNRSMCFPNDTLTCKGKVTNKYSKKGENFIECEVWIESQKAEKTTLGEATLTLP